MPRPYSAPLAFSPSVGPVHTHYPRRLLGLAIGLALAQQAVAADHFTSASSATLSSSASYDELAVANTSDPAQLTITGGSTVIATSVVNVGRDATYDNGVAGGNQGTLQLTGGAQLTTSGDATLALGTSTQGTVDLAAGTQWQVGGRLNVGREGLGTLNSAGTLVSATAMVGDLAGGVGSSVALTGGSWTNTGALVVGGAATASASISGTATLTNTGGVLTLGNSSGVTGSLTLGGANSLNAGELRIGNYGTGSFAPTNATLASTDAFLGYYAGSTGNTATLDNSTWTVTGNLHLGYGGAGTLNLQGTSGSAMTASGNGVLGHDPGSQGTLTLASGSSLGVAELTVGHGGTGGITADGATLSATGAVLGRQAGSTGTVTLTNNTHLNLGSGVLYVGNTGSGTLTLASGAHVTANDVYVGWDTGGSGTLRLNAGAGTSTIGNGIYFNNGSGTVAFNHGGTYTVGHQLQGAGSVSIESGTTVFTGGTTYTGTTTIASGATLRIGNGGTTGQLHSDVSNSGTLVFERSDAVTYAAALSGTGALDKLGAGTLTLTGNSPTYTGLTRVQAGGLMIGGVAGGPGQLGGAVQLSAGTTLGGHGYLGALSGSGTVAPGSSIGTLTVTGAADLSTSTLQAEIDAAAPAADLLAVGGAATLTGGTLHINNLAGTPTAGQSFTLLTAGAVSGEFATVTFAQSYPGLTPSVQYTPTAVRVVFAATAPAAGGVRGVPTLSAGGLALMGLVLAGAMAWQQRRRRA